MTRLFSGSIQVDGVQIHYHRTGEPKPPMLLLHGYSDNGLCWNRVPVRLGVEYDVVMMDSRGHGDSQVGEQAVNSDGIAGDALALIEDLQLKQPVIYGHSMGADAAARAAARAPQVVRALVLEDPPWFETSEPVNRLENEVALQRRRNWMTQAKSLSLEELATLGQLQNPTWDASEFPEWAKSKHQFNLMLLDRYQPAAQSWQIIAGQIACPGLVLTADPQRGALITAEVAQKITSLWPESQVVHISGAGHNIHREQFDLSMQAVERFLSKLDKWKA